MNIAGLIACFSDVYMVIYIMKPLIWRYYAAELGRISYTAWKELPHSSPHIQTPKRPKSQVKWNFTPKPLVFLPQALPYTHPRTGSSFPITPHDPPNHPRSRSSKNPIFPALCPPEYLSSADFSIYLRVLLYCETGSYNGEQSFDWS